MRKSGKDHPKNLRKTGLKTILKNQEKKNGLKTTLKKSRKSGPENPWQYMFMLREKGVMLREKGFMLREKGFMSE